MKVIFLDFDGVLNSKGSFVRENRIRKEFLDTNGYESEELGPTNETLDPTCTSNLQYLLDHHSDAKIVLSTTWRNLFSMDWLKAKLQSYGIDSSRVIDKTPEIIRLSSVPRCQEIGRYLEEHPEVTNFVILDDMYMLDKSNIDRHVKTTWNDGLGFSHTLKAIILLNDPNNKVQDITFGDDE